MKTIIAVFFLAGCAALASNGLAATDMQELPAEVQQGATAAEQAGELIFIGLVKKHEDGAALITAEKVYPLLGGDFAMVIGREVRITGSVVKKNDVEKVVVSTLQTKEQ